MPPPDDQVHLASAPHASAEASPGLGLGVFRQFAVELIAIRSEDALLWHVARNVVGRMGFTDCTIYGFDSAGLVLRRAAAAGDDTPAGKAEPILNPASIPLGEGVTGAVAQSRTARIIDDLGAGSRDPSGTSAARSEICVPILNGDELLGVIDCRHPMPQHFGPHELGILTSVAALTAAQIMQIRLVRECDSTRWALARALEISEQAQHGQNRFLANASHELRTPLNSIIGFSSLLTRPGYFAADPDRGAAQAGTILEAGQQLASIINDILELTAAAGGRLSPTPECLDIGWEVEEATLKFRNRPGQPEIIIEEIAGPDPIQAWCDIRHFHTILGKLTGNAITATPPGCPVTIRISHADDQVDVTVCDQGPGMPGPCIETIFAPFGHDGSAGAPGPKGAGLGLTLARELALANLADISLVSRPGAGCEFTLRLPASSARDRTDTDASG